MKLPHVLMIWSKIKVVLGQRDDFEIFKDSLDTEINTIHENYLVLFKNIQEDNSLSSIEKKEQKDILQKQFDLDLLELKSDANIALNKSDSDKKKQFEIWRDSVPKIFIAWFVLITADTLSDVHLFFKYIALMGGIYMTWSSLIDISLFGQRASFARSCLKKINILRGRKFCYFQFSSNCFNDKNGLTRFYASTTSSHIRQHKRILFFLIVFILFSLVWDYTSIRDWCVTNLLG